MDCRLAVYFGDTPAGLLERGIGFNNLAILPRGLSKYLQALDCLYMQINEAINRGKNLLATSVVALAGIAFLPEFFLESDLEDKIDDGLLFVLAIIAVAWYLISGNRFKRSMIPVILVCLACLDKIIGLVIEFKDKEAVGDDFGGVILFVAATILVIWQYLKQDSAL